MHVLYTLWVPAQHNAHIQACSCLWAWAAGLQSALLAFGHDWNAAEWLVIIHCACLNFTLFKNNFLNITAIFPHLNTQKRCYSDGQPPSCVTTGGGSRCERINASPSETFLQNNCPIMTASSRVLCKSVSHISRLCTAVSGGVEWENIIFFEVNTAAGVHCSSSRSMRS